MSITTNFPTRCDVFCNVVDNFGDAGVCWRLARELAAVTDWNIRLIIDQPQLVNKLDSKIASNLEIVMWGQELDDAPIADIVIETFACRLPDPYFTQMRRREKPPVWVNLEYLSAELWIDGCHGLPSPDPQSGIAKYFFFPGFTSTSGGLIRERRLDALVSEMQDDALRRDWIQSLGVNWSGKSCLVSLFCYANSPINELTCAWKNSSRPIHCLITAGLPSADLQKIIDNATLEGIKVTRLPFLPQDDYDRLLAACDVNFVRGEDSFVRAQWVGKPFIWQAYRQAEGTHFEKLHAFLNRYLSDMPEGTAKSVTDLHGGWNGSKALLATDWWRFLCNQENLIKHNQVWAQKLAKLGNLAENLAVFCKSKL